MSAGAVYVVVLIGTDGSGKTTIGDGLSDRLKVPVTYCYFGMRNFRLGIAQSMYARNGDHGRLFRFLVLPIEYLLRRVRLPSEGVLVLDRVPGWAFAGKSMVLRALYRTVLPKADLLVLCTGDAARVVVRKPERNQEACAKDLEKWQRVAAMYPARQRITIDTTKQTAEESIGTLERCLKHDPIFDRFFNGSRERVS